MARLRRDLESAKPRLRPLEEEVEGRGLNLGFAGDRLPVEDGRRVSVCRVRVRAAAVTCARGAREATGSSPPRAGGSDSSAARARGRPRPTPPRPRPRAAARAPRAAHQHPHHPPAPPAEPTTAAAEPSRPRLALARLALSSHSAAPSPCDRGHTSTRSRVAAAQHVCAQRCVSHLERRGCGRRAADGLGRQAAPPSRRGEHEPCRVQRSPGRAPTGLGAPLAPSLEPARGPCALAGPVRVVAFVVGRRTSSASPPGSRVGSVDESLEWGPGPGTVEVVVGLASRACCRALARRRLDRSCGSSSCADLAPTCTFLRPACPSTVHRVPRADSLPLSLLPPSQETPPRTAPSGPSSRRRRRPPSPAPRSTAPTTRPTAPSRPTLPPRTARAASTAAATARTTTPPARCTRARARRAWAGRRRPTRARRRARPAARAL